ncbi:MAG: amidohydrolase family protein [Acidimicrobiales bacterium]
MTPPSAPPSPQADDRTDHRPLLLRNVEHGGLLVDVAVRSGRIEAIAPDLPEPAGAIVVEGDGGAVLPGLHDHHLHLMALAASLDSVDVGAPRVVDEPSMAATLRAAAASTAPGAWLRAIGYHEPRTRPLDRWQLDAMVPDRPVRVQHRSGALWVLNSRALAEVGLLDGAPLPPGCESSPDGAPNGRLLRLDAWLSERVPRRPPDLARVGRLLLGRGVTGVTDMTPFVSEDHLAPIAAAVADGLLPQHVIVTGAPSFDLDALPAQVTAGPAKVLLHDHDLPTPDQIAGQIRAARSRGRAVAVHCVTRASLVLTLAAFGDVGAVAGDRIEHGAVVPPELHGDLLRLGLTVVTQPNFVAERGDDYLTDVDVEDIPHLWPCRSLIAAGIPVAAGTDAPFGRPDPWQLIGAAVTRRAPSGAILGAAERLDPPAALDLLLRPGARPGAAARRVAVGRAADLCVLSGSRAEALGAPTDVRVARVIIGGRPHDAAG